MNLYQRIEIIFKNDKTNPFINMVNRKIDTQKVKVRNYTYRTIILFFLYLQRKNDKIKDLNKEIQSLNNKIRNILSKEKISKEKVKIYNDDNMLNYKIQSETTKWNNPRDNPRDRKFYLNENLVKACLNDKYLGEKSGYLPILKAYNPLNSEEKNIIKIFSEEIEP